MLPVVYRVLFGVWRLVFGGWCLSVVVCCPLFGVLVLGVCCVVVGAVVRWRSALLVFGRWCSVFGVGVRCVCALRVAPWSMVFGRWSLVSGRWSLVGGILFFGAWCFGDRCLLFVVCCCFVFRLLFVVRCVLRVACWLVGVLMFGVWCVWCLVCGGLVRWRSVFVVWAW